MAQRVRRLLMGALMVSVAGVLLLAGGVTRAALTQAQQDVTLEFLLSFTSTIPGLKSIWRGTNWCSWPHVGCNTDTDITVIIDAAGFTGSLPELRVSGNSADIVITEISLRNMSIKGGFKDSWGGLKNVRVLDFSNTPMFGTIPMSWNSMRSLQKVVLKNSSACGSLPKWTQNSLQSIDVSDNLLRGSMPDTWGYLSNLMSVNLVGNKFCGCKPRSWVSRVLTNALIQAMGSAPFQPNCRVPFNCGTEGAKCTRDMPQYDGATASPSCMVMTVGTLLLALACIFSM
ncbi:surface antigen-like protein [Leishmania tarentolae]|uniref:Surface antigen-like protein n=1 Tax=Leishmania tarentolae TaxID=5689 RepID=A0A640KAA3_LEITA|nr:surface antigen-like protein [Leishmania tarentolae]GET86312.1 surface antigen-like protein [Leishmania tarentolae]GET94027.1 surface antigen-like protein [Leishmania tarentolae]